MDILPIIIAASGGLNIVQLIVHSSTIRSQRRKEVALATQEEANSVSKTQDIYDKLTATIQREREYFDARYEKLILTNRDLELTVDALKKELRDYREKCGLCSNNETKAA